MGTYSHRFSSALLALLPPAPVQGAAQDRAAAATRAAAALSGSGLAELLLMAHHPAISAGVAHKQSAWQQACRRLLNQPTAALKGAVQDQQTGLCMCMFRCAKPGRVISCRAASVRVDFSAVHDLQGADVLGLSCGTPLPDFAESLAENIGCSCVKL